MVLPRMEIWNVIRPVLFSGRCCFVGPFLMAAFFVELVDCDIRLLARENLESIVAGWAARLWIRFRNLLALVKRRNQTVHGEHVWCGARRCGTDSRPVQHFCPGCEVQDRSARPNEACMRFPCQGVPWCADRIYKGLVWWGSGLVCCITLFLLSLIKCCTLSFYISRCRIVSLLALLFYCSTMRMIDCCLSVESACFLPLQLRYCDDM